MTRPPVIQLKKDEDRRIRAGHLWIFSNEIDVRATPLAPLEPGQIVEVRDARGASLGVGYANPHSLIAIRLLARRGSNASIESLLHDRIERAFQLRESLFPGKPFYRLIFGEGDGLPGLVVDRFGPVLVVQPTTAGIERILETVVPMLAQRTGCASVLIRADTPARLNENLPLYTRVAIGSVPESIELEENGARFEAPLLTGQKTGWFFDHRLNRQRLNRYVPGKRVLDVFSYVGGWGIQAVAAGAREVTCVDSSSSAIAGVIRNAAINGVSGVVRTAEGDAFEILQKLKDQSERFDVVVLDPPAFIKRKKDLKEGEQAYRRLNRLGFELLAERGLLVSASCSFHMERDMLLRAVLWGATGARQEAQVIEEGHQGPDHPFHPAIPETNYLKAFFVRLI